MAMNWQASDQDILYKIRNISDSYIVRGTLIVSTAFVYFYILLFIYFYFSNIILLMDFFVFISEKQNSRSCAYKTLESRLKTLLV